jgi:hypothetical protein
LYLFVPLVLVKLTLLFVLGSAYGSVGVAYSSVAYYVLHLACVPVVLTILRQYRPAGQGMAAGTA